MLDHILASPISGPRLPQDNNRQCGALLDETEPAWLGALRPGSYHAPVVAEFELP